jgi:hypothetical protein
MPIASGGRRGRRGVSRTTISWIAIVGTSFMPAGFERRQSEMGDLMGVWEGQPRRIAAAAPIG